jgi:hypothetical protein
MATLGPECFPGEVTLLSQHSREEVWCWSGMLQQPCPRKPADCSQVSLSDAEGGKAFYLKLF